MSAPKESNEEWLAKRLSATKPAPVAAPSCGRAWCKPDNRCADCTPQCTVCGRWSGHCGCVVPAPVAAPCAGCEEYQILVENLKFRLKMAEGSDPNNVLSKHNAMLMAVRNADHYKAEWEACHRQHEQCMKLLEKCSLRLSPGNLRDLVREMLSKGELPEGSL